MVMNSTSGKNYSYGIQSHASYGKVGSTSWSHLELSLQGFKKDANCL